MTAVTKKPLIEALVKRYKKNDDENDQLKEIYSAIFKECPGVDFIFAYGYTPSFNDGDPCYYSQEICVMDWGDEMYPFGIEYHDGEEIYPEWLVDTATKFSLKLPNSANSNHDECKVAYDLLNSASHLFQTAYGVDGWKVWIHRTDDENFIVHKERYDRGY